MTVTYVCSGCKMATLPTEDQDNIKLYPIEFDTLESCLHHIHDTHGESKAEAIKVIKFYRAAGEFGFLSNLFPAEIWLEMRRFTCSEYAYQYGKPNNKDVAEWLVSAPKPHLCAAAAHSLFVFDVKPDWSKTKVERMTRVLRAKFLQNLDLAVKLLETGDAILIEQSNMDAYWGIGKKGNGQNMLGKLLMQVRGELMEYGSGVQRIGFIRITSQFDDDDPLPIRLCKLGDSGYKAMDSYIHGTMTGVRELLFQGIEYCVFIEQVNEDKEAKETAGEVKSKIQKIISGKAIVPMKEALEIQQFFMQKRRKYLIPALNDLKRKETLTKCERQFDRNLESIHILTDAE